MTYEREGAELPTENLIRGLGPAALELRDGSDGEAPILSVRAMPFGEWAEIDSEWEGRFMERFVPGSLDESFAQETPKILFQHGKDPTMGRQVLAAPVTARADDREAVLEAPLGDGIPPLIVWGIRQGVYGASIQFHAQEQEIVRNPKRSDYNPLGLTERTVTKARIREGGPVTWGAYANASTSMRSLTDEFRDHDFDTDLARMARQHPKDLASLIEKALKGSEPEPPEPKAPAPSRFRSREEYLQWLSKS